MVNIAILLTTPDKTSHLGALFDINEIAEDEQLVSELIKLETKEGVIRRLKNSQRKAMP